MNHPQDEPISNSTSTAFDQVREEVKKYSARSQGRLLAVSAVLIGMTASLAATIVDRRTRVDPLSPPEPFSLTIFSTLIIIFVLYAVMRIALAFLSPKQASIPIEDRALLEPMIMNGDEKAIDQYVRVSSLSGSTGVATKLGLTGLPLITVALTLVFSSLELYRPGAGFMDLAKLTLGAFIGSFVQRAATTQAIASSGKFPAS